MNQKTFLQYEHPGIQDGDVLRKLNDLILRTPTGADRETLTETHILLLTLADENTRWEHDTAQITQALLDVRKALLDVGHTALKGIRGIMPNSATETGKLVLDQRNEGT